jgi:hypothetical protein
VGSRRLLNLLSYYTILGIASGARDFREVRRALQTSPLGTSVQIPDSQLFFQSIYSDTSTSKAIYFEKIVLFLTIEFEIQQGVQNVGWHGA